tara:strand:+ start:10349 stop:10837 length:489 start_codon:yes stop_codon:yes gene_type:complete
LYAALLISFLLFGCSKLSTEPKLDEPMLTPIEDLGFSHDVEADDGEWDSLEKVYAKFTAQWYADSNGLARNVESPGYVLREREVFLDGVCSLWRDEKVKRDDGEWLIRIYGPDYNFEVDWPPGDYLLYVNKHVTVGKPWYDISWNANYKGEAAYSKSTRDHN